VTQQAPDNGAGLRPFLPSLALRREFLRLRNRLPICNLFLRLRLPLCALLWPARETVLHATPTAEKEPASITSLVAALALGQITVAPYAPVLAATLDAGKASVVTRNGWLAFLKKNRLSGAVLPIKRLTCAGI
jgi:hypothetical protein